jgi:hypothetical protein
VSYTSATVLAASLPFELQALALKERYESKKVLLSEGPEETPRHVNLGRNTAEYMETLARMAGGRNPDKTTPGSMRRASQLGGVEEQKRSSTNVQDDPDTNRTRGVWRIPATHRKGDDVQMPSL